MRQPWRVCLATGRLSNGAAAIARESSRALQRGLSNASSTRPGDALASRQPSERSQLAARSSQLASACWSLVTRALDRGRSPARQALDDARAAAATHVLVCSSARLRGAAVVTQRPNQVRPARPRRSLHTRLPACLFVRLLACLLACLHITRSRTRPYKANRAHSPPCVTALTHKAPRAIPRILQQPYLPTTSLSPAHSASIRSSCRTA